MKLVTNGLDMRQNNQNRVYRLIYDTTEPLTKQDIARRLNMSLPTVTQHLNELMAGGYLAYSGTMASTGGRKARSISVLASARYAIGMNVNDKWVSFVAIDLKVNQLAYQRYAQPYDASDVYLGALAGLLDRFISESDLIPERVLGVGVALPGLIDEKEDVLKVAPTLNARQRNMAPLRAMIPYPVCFINDASASGFAEYWSGAEQNNMAYLSIERGVGGTVLTGGQPYSGDHGRSGEFGHMCVVPDGRQCKCGKSGCLEAYCSVSRISDDLDMTPEQFFQKLHEGNKQLAIVWAEYMEHLARAIANIRSVLDCDVVISGMLAPFLNDYLDDLRAMVGRMSPFDSDGSYVRLSRYRAHSAGTGAALTFIRDYISSI